MWLNSLLTIYVHAVLDADPDVAGGVPVCWSLLVQPEDETCVLMILLLGFEVGVSCVGAVPSLLAVARFNGCLSCSSSETLVPIH
ncbi:hypothetical protein Nepgr_022961 [Nepenthes gracilis]|uniref:Uncharacterized protein n=1 Tax=Nepenthes gracilis TaxID=150966 RepID=A0AAD3XYK8_NEPGR|nr:hypothetical protein Nepgr_022961 [Nepenthes gracilis]